MRIAITGATGLLGRNLLFEILKQNLNNLSNIELFILGRPEKSLSLEERLKQIILDDGFDYIGIDKKSLGILEEIEKIVHPVPFDLAIDNLAISNSDFNELNKKPTDYFFHIAALTDFRSGKSIEEKLQEINVNGTKRICNLIDSLKLKEAIYIGSAYSCGDKTGLVKPDYINSNSKFRNPYEKSKLEGEVYFRNFAKERKLKYRVFRPSTICGRLIEKPIGATCKFDVFYGWGAFFLREKIKYIKDLAKIYDIPYEMSVRIVFNPKGGLNIVPADYAAKILYSVCINDSPNNSYYLANDKEAPHQLYISLILNGLNITGYKFVEQEPTQDLTPIEKFHYKTVGKIFAPYTTSKSIDFDTSNLLKVKQRFGISCPTINKSNFLKLLDFAKQKYFGLTKDEA